MTNEAQTLLFQKNLDWAASLARLVHRTLPPSFDQGDLIQIAWIELWKRVELYNGNLGDTSKFRGYANLYIRGACKMASRRNAYRENTHEELVTAESYDDSEKLRSAKKWDAGRAGGAGTSVIAEPSDPRPQQDEAIDIERQIIEQEALFRKRMRSVKRKIAKLPAHERVLIYAALKGRTVQEIAAAQGVPTLSLSRRLSGIVRKLKNGRKPIEKSLVP